MGWDIIISKNVSPSRFNIEYPYVKPLYFTTKVYQQVKQLKETIQKEWYNHEKPYRQ